MNQRFEQVDQRFEQVDQRFEQIDQRFEQVDQRFDSLTAETNQRFDIKRMDGMEAWIKLMVGDMGNQKGSTSEDLVAAALRYGLKEDDIDADTIRLRQPLHDPTGLVFRAGYKSEIDIIAQNGHITIFEVKTTYVKPGEVGIFAMKLDLFSQQSPDVEVKGLLIVSGANERTQKECDEYGIRLLT